MKILLIITCIILLLPIVITIYKIKKLKNITYNQPEILANKKILTVYYSNNSNTKNVAQNINAIVGGDIKEIELTTKYPNNIFTMSKLVRKQIKENFLPQIENIDISNYDVIFIGSPTWIFSMALPAKAFLKNNNFKNKIIIPFITYSGGANKTKIVNEIKNLTNTNDIKKALFMFENGILLVKEQIINWLNNI